MSQEGIMKKVFLLAAVSALAIIGAGNAEAADKLLFALQWIPNGNHFGVFAAKEEGFYKEAGLDVDIQRGFGSGDTAKRVAVGNADVGIADAGSVILGRSNGLKLKFVASFYEKSPDVIFFMKNNGIEKPKDLEGKTIGATTGEAGEKLIPMFAEKTGFDSKKLSVLNIAPSAKYASLVAKSVDSIVGFVNEAPPIEAAARKTGLQVGQFVFADVGIDYYSLGIVASDKMIAERPDAVRRFVAATMKGYAWAIKNPERAADDFVKNYPETTRAIVIEQWNAALPLIVTDSARKNGLGAIDAGKMADTLKLISQVQKVDSTIAAKDVYLTDFIPDVKVE
jgi:NitT/TauT family transport system substrate-binding protein